MTGRIQSGTEQVMTGRIQSGTEQVMTCRIQSGTEQVMTGRIQSSKVDDCTTINEWPDTRSGWQMGLCRRAERLLHFGLKATLSVALCINGE